MDVIAELRPEWRAFFDRNTPNDVILSAALAGRCPALAFVDRAGSPTQIAIRAHGGKAFAGTGVSESFLHEVVDRFETFEPHQMIQEKIPVESFRMVEVEIGNVHIGDKLRRTVVIVLRNEYEVGNDLGYFVHNSCLPGARSPADADEFSLIHRVCPLPSPLPADLAFRLSDGSY